MAPEVLFSQIHSFSVDFYAVGVIAYEFMKGYRPYQGKDRKEIKEAILEKEVFIGPKSLKNEGWSFEGGDFINRMIKRKVRKRLGFFGINEIKNHSWLKDVNWDELLIKKIESPYIPSEGDNFDKKFCEFTNEFYEENNMKEKYNNLLKQKDHLNLFKNYTYIRQEEKEKIFGEMHYKNKYNNNHINKELKKSLSKIIQTNYKNQVRIIDGINNENRNILNYNYNNDKNKLSKSKTMNYFYPSPKNRKIFHKKRIPSKDSKINSTIRNNSLNKTSTNKLYKNNIIIINPYYNQNINYFQEKEAKDKIEIDYNYNYNTIKNLSPRIRPSYSMKTIKSNFDFQRIGEYNLNNNIEKESIIYSPPHVLSPKFRTSRSNNKYNNNKKKFGTLDYISDYSEYNTINQLNNNLDEEKQMILNRLKSNNTINNKNVKNSKTNKSDLLRLNNINFNNYFYSTLNKFHNRLASEKMIYSSFNIKNKNNKNSITKKITDYNQISHYNIDQNISKIKKEKVYYIDKNNFNKSKRIKNNIESYSKRNKNYENVSRKKFQEKTVFNHHNSKVNHSIKKYETINNIDNNNSNNIFKIKVNLIPRPYSISKPK